MLGVTHDERSIKDGTGGRGGNADGDVVGDAGGEGGGEERQGKERGEIGRGSARGAGIPTIKKTQDSDRTATIDPLHAVDEGKRGCRRSWRR